MTPADEGIAAARRDDDRARNAQKAALGRLHDLAERLQSQYHLDLAAVGAPSCTHSRMEYLIRDLYRLELEAPAPPKASEAYLPSPNVEGDIKDFIDAERERRIKAILDACIGKKATPEQLAELRDLEDSR